VNTRTLRHPTRFPRAAARFLASLTALAPCLLLAPPAAHASQDDAAPSRIAIAVPAVEVLSAVAEKVAGHGQRNELAQIVQGLDAKLADALQNTRKFEVRAHAELAKIIGEQQAQDSGNFDLSDPKRAKPFQLAGIPYLALVQIDDFQDQVQTARFEGVGQQATRRQIRLSAVCRIFDTTRGTLLESTRVTLADFDLKNNPQYVVDQRGGDLTEAVINLIADRMADRVAQRVTDIVFPAKVLVVRDGVVTLNRGEGTDIAVGDIWEVFALGEALIDPDTGENLGSEEVAVGFVRVISVAPKFSRAEICGADRGIARNAVLRKTTRSSCGDGGARMYMPLLPQEADAPPLRGPGRAAGDGPRVPPVAPPAARGDRSGVESDESPRYSAAIFVRSRERRLDDERLLAFEDLLVGELDGACFRVMSREDVVNAVAKFAREGSNAGTGRIPPEKDLDRLLSDQASAVALAQAMGADYILVASLTALSIDRRTLNDPARGVRTDVESYRLDASYRILGRADGAAVATGVASASDALRQGAGLAVERDMIGELLRTSAAKMASAMRKRCEQTPLPRPDALVRVPLQIDAASSELSIPEIVRDGAGNLVVAGGTYRIAPSDFIVEIDGVVAGSTPAAIEAVQGLRKLRVSRPDFEPFEATINAQPGTGPIRVPMRLTEGGLARVREMTAFFSALKREERLTEAQAAVLEGFAAFLGNSKHSVEERTDIRIDTKEAPVFENNSFWRGLPWLR